MAFSSSPSLQGRCPDPRAEPGSLSGFCSGCLHWKHYSNWFYGQSPFLPCGEQSPLKTYLWRTIMGIPMGFISQRTIRVDGDSKYHRLLGDLACLEQADLLLPFPLWEGFPSKELILRTTPRCLLGVIWDICFISHLQLIRILYRSWVYKGFFIVPKFIQYFFLQATRQKIQHYYGIYNFLVVGIFILLIGRYQYLLTASWYIQIDHCSCFYLSSGYLFVIFFWPSQESATDPQCLFQDELQCYSLENFLLWCQL